MAAVAFGARIAAVASFGGALGEFGGELGFETGAAVAEKALHQ